MSYPTHSDEVAATAEVARRYAQGAGGTSTIEAALSVWHDAKWPDKGDDRLVTNKLAEEAGEVCGAATKMAEGRATIEALADEMGDVLICLAVLAGRYEWTLPQLLRRRALGVLAR